MAYLVKDNTCVFTDEIICIDGVCSKCEVYLKHKLKDLKQNVNSLYGNQLMISSDGKIVEDKNERRKRKRN